MSISVATGAEAAAYGVLLEALRGGVLALSAAVAEAVRQPWGGGVEGRAADRADSLLTNYLQRRGWRNRTGTRRQRTDVYCWMAMKVRLATREAWPTRTRNHSAFVDMLWYVPVRELQPILKQT